MVRCASRVVLALALTLALAAPAGAITAWDQAKVTELARQLVSAVDGLRDALRDSPQWTYPGQRTVLYQIRDDLRWIENESISLHADLAKGANMEATLNSFKRIQFLRRDAQALAERTQTTAFTQPKLDAARKVLEQLAAYYPPEASNP